MPAIQASEFDTMDDISAEQALEVERFIGSINDVACNIPGAPLTSFFPGLPIIGGILKMYTGYVQFNAPDANTRTNLIASTNSLNGLSQVVIFFVALSFLAIAPIACAAACAVDFVLALEACIHAHNLLYNYDYWLQDLNERRKTLGLSGDHILHIDPDKHLRWTEMPQLEKDLQDKQSDVLIFGCALAGWILLCIPGFQVPAIVLISLSVGFYLFKYRELVSSKMMSAYTDICSTLTPKPGVVDKYDEGEDEGEGDSGLHPHFA